MALIRNANAATIARDAIVLDLGDLREQGERMLRGVRAEAERVMEQAKSERARILEGAAEQGRAEGHAAGLEEGRAAGRIEAKAEALAEHGEELGKIAAAWTASLEEFSRRRDDLVRGALQDVVRLGVAIGERLTKRTIELNPEVVRDQLAATLAVVVRPTELTIRIHPEDRAIVERALPGLVAAMPAIRHAEIVDDPSVERGGCLARSRADANGEDAGGGEIDARIGVQLERIVSTLLPGEQPPDGERSW
jgi:flagellar biosynthesis/type III secretory pathway protein FliH